MHNICSVAFQQFYSNQSYMLNMIRRHNTTDYILREFLSKNGCKFEDENVGDDNVKTATFIYRGGMFVAQYRIDSTELLLAFPRCFDSTTDDSEKYLMICNELTHNLKYVKFVVEFDETDNHIFISISHETMNVSEEMIESFTSLAFAFQDEVRKRIEDGSSNLLKNPEYVLDIKREKYLLDELELYSDDSVPSEVKRGNVMCLGQMIETLFTRENVNDFSRMTCIYPNDKIHIIDDSYVISNFNVLDAVYDKENDSCVEELTLLVRTQLNTYTFNILPRDNTEYVVYFSISAAKSSTLQQEDVKHLGHRPRPSAVSFLIAYDKTTEKNKQKEFEYMWLDAQDKRREGREDELSEEQKWLVNLEENDFSYQFYWGKKNMLANRYLEAIERMQPLYESMRADFFNYDQSSKDLFFDVCYILGMSYLKLQQLEKAFYYLDFSSSVSRPKYGVPFINTLIKAGDLRVFRELDLLDSHLLNMIKQMPDGEPSDDQLQYHLYLMRKNAAARLFFKDYDVAESIFKELLEFDETREYAEKELQYLEFLRKQSNNDNDTSDNGQLKKF